MELDKILPSLLPMLAEPHTAIVVVCVAALAVVALALTKIPRP